MISLFDHLVAVLISSIVVLTLFNVQMRAQSSSIERTLMYDAKKQTLTLAEIIERDLSNAGYDRNPSYQFRIREYSTTSASDLSSAATDIKVTETFEFWGGYRSSSSDPLQSVPIRYRLENAGTAVVDGTNMALFQLKREVCLTPPDDERSSGVEPCPGTWKLTAASTPTLTRFHIQMRDGSNVMSDTEPISKIDKEARRLRVWVYNAIAPQVESEMRHLSGHRQLFWRTELSPGGLRGDPSSSS